MSTTASSSQRPEFDFWEFVSCARCHLPFSSSPTAPPQVPFWITECGHVICNNHLNSDQSCVECGAQGIQVAALQREMEAPMSDWFRSAPQAVDTIAYSIRFQIETLASLVRYYKKKCSQQRALLERAKTDSQGKALRKTIEDLQAENQQLREYVGYEPSEVVNMNGKRRMTEVHRHASGARSNSSPRSIATPLGPDRLTLPPSHQQLTSRRQPNSDDGPQRPPSSHPLNTDLTARRERPGSSRFIDRQYAYDHPQQPSHVVPNVISHAQTVPARSAHARQQQQSQDGPQKLMMPPPKADYNNRNYLQSSRSSQYPQVSVPPGSNGARQTQMPPPPLPPHQSGLESRHGLQSMKTRQQSSFRPAADHQLAPGQPSMSSAVSGRTTVPSTPSRAQEKNSNILQSNRYLPPSMGQSRQESNLQTQRFMPATPSTSRFSNQFQASGSGVISSSAVDAGSRDSSRASIRTSGGGGQRMPFVPAGAAEFG